MKLSIFTALLLCFSWSGFSQSTLEYFYDDAGNRYRKSILVTKMQEIHLQEQDSIKELSIDSKTNVYPNPTSSFLEIESGNLRLPYRYSLNDLNGKPYLEGKMSDAKSTLYIKELAVGIYLLYLDDNKLKLTFKIVKN